MRVGYKLSSQDNNKGQNLIKVDGFILVARNLVQLFKICKKFSIHADF